MATWTTPPNEELVLTGAVRAALAGTPWAGALVTNRLTTRGTGEEVAPSQDYAVIIRGDGGPDGEPPTFTRRVGIRIFGPDGDDNHVRTSALARHLVPVLHRLWELTPAVAATRAVNGPYRVPATVGRPEMYATAELVLVGTPIH